MRSRCSQVLSSDFHLADEKRVDGQEDEKIIGTAASIIVLLLSSRKA